MAKKRGGKTVVRGADGALYLLRKGVGPVKLAENQAKEVCDVIKKVEKKLKAIVAKEMECVACGCNQNVEIKIKDAHIK